MRMTFNKNTSEDGKCTDILFYLTCLGNKKIYIKLLIKSK